MRIFLWHDYLLGGTDSNVYTRSIARAWNCAGHDVTVVGQQPHPEDYDLAGARAVRPDIGGTRSACRRGSRPVTSPISPISSAACSRDRPTSGQTSPHARRVVEERWSWEHVADRLLEPFT